MVHTFMNLTILLPHRIFLEKKYSVRIVADTREGSFGLLPNRLDCAAALCPGILTYETKEEGTVFLAIDEGLLVKTGPDVLVSVRRAVAGFDLARLKEAVEREFLVESEQEKSMRHAIDKLESGFIRRLTALRYD